MGSAVHLVSARELFPQGYPCMPAVAVCGEVVIDKPDGEEDSRYCLHCVRAALRWKRAIMPESRVQIEATCEVHGGSGHLVMRCEGGRIVLDGNADQCCVFTLEGPAVTLIQRELLAAFDRIRPAQ